MEIDWNMIDRRNVIRPKNNEIIRMSKGIFDTYVFHSYVNWAFKVAGEFGWAAEGVMPTSQDYGVLVKACQKVVKEENLQYIPEPEPKKSGWFFKEEE